MKVVVAVRPPVSVAVMVTGVGPAGPSGGVYDQLQVPVASFLVTVPSEAVSVTVLRPWASSKVPRVRGRGALVDGHGRQVAGDRRRGVV